MIIKRIPILFLNSMKRKGSYLNNISNSFVKITFHSVYFDSLEGWILFYFSLNYFSFQNSSVENNYLLYSAKYIIFWNHFRLKNKCVFFWVFSSPLFVFLSIRRKSRARSLSDSEPNDKSQFVLTKKSVVVWDKDHFLYPI